MRWRPLQQWTLAALGCEKLFAHKSEIRDDANEKFDTVIVKGLINESRSKNRRRWQSGKSRQAPAQADYVLIVLPMLLSVILLIIFLIVWSVIMRTSGHTTGIAGFNYDGYVIIGAIFLCLASCIGYGLLALILSFLTISNRTFRTVLVTISLLAAGCFLFPAF